MKKGSSSLTQPSIMMRSHSSSSSLSATSSPPLPNRRSKVITDDDENDWSSEKMEQTERGASSSSSIREVVAMKQKSITTTTSSGKTKKKNIAPILPEYTLIYEFSPSMIAEFHSKPISCVKFSPDGSSLAVASADGTITIWNLIENLPQGNGEETNQMQDRNTSDTNNGSSSISGNNQELSLSKRTTCSGHLLGVNDVCWSPDSQYLCSASDDKTIRIWSAEDGELLKTLQGHNQFAYCVAFSPRGNVIASGSFDETVRMWDVRTGNCLRTLPAHSDPVSSVSFSRDGSLLITSSYDGFCRVWDTTTGQCLKTILVDTQAPPPLSCAKLSPFGNYLLISCMSTHEYPQAALRLWQLRPDPIAKNIRTFRGHVNDRFSSNITFHPKLNLVVSCSEDGFVYIWDIQSGNIVTKLNCNTGHDTSSNALSTQTTNNNDHQNSQLQEGNLSRTEMDTSDDHGHPFPVISLDISTIANANFVVACTNEPRLILWREALVPGKTF
ncbi:hypothetical protein C9374_000703 [Naegleria lovaniensis]|uniref:WDR5-like beta-propeller domain-containing protein n=1 Tax=Naegleria lovaniensis TaxID=51637 RepID=A0AA88KNY3_NAELO|nr:uncharacterized protein C9374_000703 [Naegleria lovaniensis]KAG2388539.1 hypothetical protein C9374_000703 [Naegleria lovaniensis]